LPPPIGPSLSVSYLYMGLGICGPITGHTVIFVPGWGGSPRPARGTVPGQPKPVDYRVVPGFLDIYRMTP
jgi:hypothetical protein